MARYVIGDLHGKSFWKEVQNIYKKGDEVFFLGDYFDSKTRDDTEISVEDQLANFDDAMDWASDIGAVCLLGNHDLAYLVDDPNNGTLFKHHRKIRVAFMNWIDMFKIVHITDDNYLLSHAGVSKTFMDSLGLSDPLELNNRTETTFSYKQSNGLSPAWIRPEQLIGDEFGDYEQVVGHTVQDSINKVGKTWFIDCVGDAILRLDPRNSETYDKRAIMHNANVIRKTTGLSKSAALKEAWKIAKGL